MQISAANNYQPNFCAKHIMSVKSLKNGITDIYELNPKNKKDSEFAQKCLETINDFPNREIPHNEINIYNGDKLDIGTYQYMKEQHSIFLPIDGVTGFWKKFIRIGKANDNNGFLAGTFGFRNKDSKFLIAVNNDTEPSITGLANYNARASHDWLFNCSVNTFIVHNGVKSTADAFRYNILKAFKDAFEKEPKEKAGVRFTAYPKTNKQFFDSAQKPENDWMKISYNRTLELMDEIKKRNSKNTPLKIIKNDTDYDPMLLI